MTMQNPQQTTQERYSMSTALVSLTNQLAARFSLGDGSDLMQTLRQTAFKGQVSESQMTALLIVANQYGLNPWTKEIYAFPDRNNGIVPVVGVDGWSRIINSDGNFDESCTCKIYRKDRSRPVAVTEYMSECRRDGVGPWKSHPKRMLRHKAMIQCARLAFGFAGIYDQDEAERIAERDVTADAYSVAAAAAHQGDDSDDAIAIFGGLLQVAEQGDWDAFGKAWSSLTDNEKSMVGSARFSELKIVCKENMPGD